MVLCPKFVIIVFPFGTKLIMHMPVNVATIYQHILIRTPNCSIELLSDEYGFLPVSIGLTKYILSINNTNIKTNIIK